MSESSDEDESWVFRLNETLQRIKENDPSVELIELNGEYMQNMTNEELEELGRDIANNTHLTDLHLCYAALNYHRMSCLFRGLTRSSSITEFELYGNLFGIAGVRSMVPFLQNANNLTNLDLDDNNIQTEGFGVVKMSGSE